METGRISTSLLVAQCNARATLETLCGDILLWLIREDRNQEDRETKMEFQDTCLHYLNRGKDLITQATTTEQVDEFLKNASNQLIDLEQRIINHVEG